MSACHSPGMSFGGELPSAPAAAEPPVDFASVAGANVADMPIAGLQVSGGEAAAVQEMQATFAPVAAEMPAATFGRQEGDVISGLLPASPPTMAAIGGSALTMVNMPPSPPPFVGF